MVIAGTIMLWFGWYGFNCGSTLVYSSPASLTYSRVAMNTTLAPSSAGLLAVMLNNRLTGTFDIRCCCNGLLSGARPPACRVIMLRVGYLRAPANCTEHGTTLMLLWTLFKRDLDAVKGVWAQYCVRAM